MSNEPSPNNEYYCAWIEAKVEARQTDLDDLQEDDRMRMEQWDSEIPGDDKNHPNHPDNNPYYPFVCNGQNKLVTLMPYSFLRDQGVMTADVWTHQIMKEESKLVEKYNKETADAATAYLKKRNHFVRAETHDWRYSVGQDRTENIDDSGDNVLYDAVSRGGKSYVLGVLMLEDSLGMLDGAVGGHEPDKIDMKVFQEAWKALKDGKSPKKGLVIAGLDAHKRCLIGRHGVRDATLVRITIKATGKQVVLYVPKDSKRSPSRKTRGNPRPPVDEITIEDASDASLRTPSRAARRPPQDFGTPSTVGTTVTNRSFAPFQSPPKLQLMHNIASLIQQEADIEQDEQQTESRLLADMGQFAKDTAENHKQMLANERDGLEKLDQANKNMKRSHKDMIDQEKSFLGVFNNAKKDNQANNKNREARRKEAMAKIDKIWKAIENSDENGNPKPPKRSKWFG